MPNRVLASSWTSSAAVSTPRSAPIRASSSSSSVSASSLRLRRTAAMLSRKRPDERLSPAAAAAASPPARPGSTCGPTSSGLPSRLRPRPSLGSGAASACRPKRAPPAILAGRLMVPTGSSRRLPDQHVVLDREGDRGDHRARGRRRSGKTERRVRLGAAAALRLDQHPGRAGRPARRDSGAAPRSPAARRRPARSLRSAFGTCGMRAAGVPARAE